MNTYPKRPARPLRWWHGLIFFAAAMGFQLLFVAVLVVLQAFEAFGPGPQSAQDALFSPASLSVQVLITSTILTVIAVMAVKLRRNPVGETLRLGKPAAFPTILAVFGIIPLGVLADQITVILQGLAPDVFDSVGLEQMVTIFSDASVGGFVLVTAMVSIGPAIGEEFMFRGLLLRSFRADFSAWGAVVLSAFLFGVLHLNMLQGSGAFLIGLYLGFTVLVTGSIWPGVLAHGVNNLICSLAARFDPQGIGQAFNQGHHPAVIVVAAVLLGGAIWGLISRRRTLARGT